MSDLSQTGMVRSRVDPSSIILVSKDCELRESGVKVNLDRGSTGTKLYREVRARYPPAMWQAGFSIMVNQVEVPNSNMKLR